MRGSIIYILVFYFRVCNYLLKILLFKSITKLFPGLENSFIIFLQHNNFDLHYTYTYFVLSSPHNKNYFCIDKS